MNTVKIDGNHLTLKELVEISRNYTKIELTEEQKRINLNSGKEQLCIRDLDGYYLIISL